MRNFSCFALALFFISIVGCGGATPPAPPQLSPEEQKQVQAAHEEKAKEAGQPANAPGGSGAPNQ
jgi:hypothetical protein